MEYQLQLKPFERRDDFKYKIMQITDVAFHTSKKTLTVSIGEKFKKAFESDKPGRVYAPIHKSEMADGKNFIVEFLRQDPDFIKMVREEELKGYKILLALPRDGIPVFPGKDTVEFIKSKNGKRILRKLAKNIDSNKI